MNNKYNSWCKWHPLKTVMLGRSYYPEFYRDIQNPKVKDCLITPHIAWATISSRQRLLETVTANIKSFIDANPKNIVNF